MNDDTFSRSEARMEEFHRKPHRASAQFADREHADRVAEQNANAQIASPFTAMNDDALDKHIHSIANLIVYNRVEKLERRIEQLGLDIACEKRSAGSNSRSDLERDLMFDALRGTISSMECSIAERDRRIAERDRRIAHLERELADLRTAQRSADTTGAHPYRSAPSIATAGPGSPVATSEAPPTSASSSGGWRRVYGALSGHAADACMALVPVLGGVSVYVMCSAAGADTFGAVLGMALSGLASVLIAKGDTV